MKTIYLTQTMGVIVDKENDTVGEFTRPSNLGINSIWLVEEPSHVVFNSGEYNKEFDAKKGDILVTFYRDDYPNKVVVIKNNKDWVKNIIALREHDQQLKESWAKSKIDKCANSTSNE